MTHGDLFAGIGGFALAAKWCGLKTVWAVEIEEYCQKVYARHFPAVEVHEDVRSIESLSHVDLLTAGFPCQAVSVAGKRLGTDDDRWLWPETIRIICLVRPRWALLENVPGLLGRGMSEVLGDLAASGYDAEWECISAAAVGAPHIRDRVWIVAYPRRVGRRGGRDEDARGQGGPLQVKGPSSGDESGVLAHPNGERFNASPDSKVQTRRNTLVFGREDVADAEENRRGTRGQGDAPQEPRRGQPDRGSISENLVENPQGERLEGGSDREEGVETEALRLFSAGSGQCGDVAHSPRGSEQSSGTQGDVGGFQESVLREGGYSHDWTVEPNVGRVAHGIPKRVDRLRGLGNAIVPQVAEWIIRQIVFEDGRK